MGHAGHVTRPDVEPLVREVFARTPNGCGHRQVLMALRHEFGVAISAKSVLRVMRRLGLRCAIRRANPWRRYSSYRGESGPRVANVLARDFTATGAWQKLGTDVTEFRLADGKAYLAPVYDMHTCEIVAWDLSRHPDLAQQKRLLRRLTRVMPEGRTPVLHSDMGWQYQHAWWRQRLAAMGVVQSMSRKGNCLDNAPTEGLFGHLKDELWRGRRMTFRQLKREMTAYMDHWNNRRRQKRLQGHTPVEYRNMTLKT